MPPTPKDAPRLQDGLVGTAFTTGDQLSFFEEGVNFVRFNGLSPVLGDNRIRFRVENGPDGIGIFNGFEIMAVPEPSSVALLGLGVLGLLGLSRRRARD